MKKINLMMMVLMMCLVTDNTWANPTSGSINGSTYYEMDDITSFSCDTGGYSVNDGALLLPVVLLNFTATEVENSYVRLDWSTAAEINNEGFEVERSMDGINCETIGWVEGNGNSTLINTYSYNDMGAVSGINYYRLKQIDFDGEFEYTYIVSANLNGVDKLQVENIRSNPAENEIYIDIDTRVDVRTTFTIYNHMGQQIDKFSRVFTEIRNEVKVDTSKYATGAYYVTIENNNVVVTKKFVISR